MEAQQATTREDEMKAHIETLENINDGLRESFEELTALYRLSETMSSARTLAKVLSLLMDISKEILDYEAGALLLYEERGEKLTLRLKRNLTPELEERIASQTREGLLLWAIKQGRPIVVPDSGAGTWTQALPADGKPKSFVLVPLVARNKVVGLLNLVSFHGEGSFTQRDLSMLSILANQASVAIENARLNEAIQGDYQEVIRALARAVDARDHFSQLHATLVSSYSALIAKNLGLSPEECESVRTGALLHDVGNLGISDSILKKPSKLTGEEFDAMKVHSVLGANLVRGIGSLAHLAPLVLYHHEHFDGGGFPEGLSGKSIPQGARIIHVADAFETMTSDRAYHAAVTVQEAVDEIKRCSGTQFDPEMVEAFCRALPECVLARQEQEGVEGND